MKKITWEDYYDNFYDWSYSTQKNYSYGLISYGDAEEVYEVAMEFDFQDKKFTANFIKKAVESGVSFLPEHIVEFIGVLDKDCLSQAAKNAKLPFSIDDLYDLEDEVNSDVYKYIVEKSGEKIDEDGYLVEKFSEEDDNIEDDFNAYIEEEKPVKIGFFTQILAFLGIIDIAKYFLPSKDSKPRPCNQRPPHYGYRFGRWYYGNNHDYGCEPDDRKDY